MATALGDEGFFAGRMAAVAMFGEEGEAIIGGLLVVLGVGFVVVPIRHSFDGWDSCCDAGLGG